MLSCAVWGMSAREEEEREENKVAKVEEMSVGVRVSGAPFSLACRWTSARKSGALAESTMQGTPSRMIPDFSMAIDSAESPKNA